MCYDSDSHPPELPVPGGEVHGEDMTVTVADGNTFSAYVAEPATLTGAQILIYPDRRGLQQFYKELALRFAESGTRALAIDYFGRTAGTTPRDDSFEFMPHVQKLQISTFLTDVTAALAYLRKDRGAHLSTFIVGFCLGGSFSLLTGTQDFALNGIIAFYAGLNRTFNGSKGTVLELAREIKYPTLGLFGGADQSIPVTDVATLDEHLDESGVEHYIVTYPGAPHSFFDRKAVDYAEASSDAWQRALGFIASHPTQS